MSIDAAAQFERAQALMDLHRYQEAAEAARRILATDPQNPRVVGLVAVAEFNAGNHQLALEAATAAIALEPDEEYMHRIASLAAIGLGDAQRAADEAGEAVRLAPNSAAAHMTLAQALMAGRQTLGARDHAEKAVELVPHSAEAHYVLGRVAHFDGRRKDAEAALKRALAIRPDHAPARNELARIRLKHGRFSGAAMADATMGFAGALQTDPRQAQIRRNLEVAVRSFLSQTAYLVFLAAYVGTVVKPSQSSGLIRLLPLLVLLIPILYAARYLNRLSPQLRRFLMDAILRRRRLLVPVCLELLAVGLIVGEVLAGQAARGTLAVAAIAAAFGARLLLWAQRKQARRAQAK